jgi:ribosomal protein S18 acetylase RimI-like enzyme
MTAYRFCRTDDMALLVAAYESCRGEEDAGVPALERAGLKDLVRELDLWCSSCMVAMEGREPVGVLLGAKRPDATLVYGLRVKPGHRRRGHGRHLLTSLGQKLAILGPPRLVAEVPAERAAARELFERCGWVNEGTAIDWRRESSAVQTEDKMRPASGAERDAVAPISLGEMVGEKLLGEGARCWHRDLPALSKLGERLRGLGFHSAERLEAGLLYRQGDEAWEILAMGSTADRLGRLALTVLVDELSRQAGGAALSFARVAPAELAPELLESLGFRSGAAHLMFSTTAQAA